MNFDARPGVGLGSIRLGMRPAKVTELVGLPNNQVKNGDEVRFDYELIKTSYFFGYNGSNRLHLIECKSPNLLVAGRKIIGTANKNLAQRLGFGEEDKEINDYGDGECFHGFPGICCYSESNVILSVQITLLFDENDRVLWPSSADLGTI